MLIGNMNKANNIDLSTIKNIDKIDSSEKSNYDKARDSFKNTIAAEIIAVPSSLVVVYLLWYFTGHNYLSHVWYIIVFIAIAIIIAPFRAWYFHKDDFEKANEDAFNDLINSIKRNKNDNHSKNRLNWNHNWIEAAASSIKLCSITCQISPRLHAGPQMLALLAFARM
jgi:F0F1-type ATP synthase assembly protein I